jgi:DNA-binding FadR family transcriptional regulator
MAPRRTPALTAKCREMFEEEILSEGWQPGGTIPRIAEAVGLSVDQVRDAIFAESADKWRDGLTARLRSGRA